MSRLRFAQSRGFDSVCVIWISGLTAAFALSGTVSVCSQALSVRNIMSGALATSVADRVAQPYPFKLSGPGVVQLVDGR